MGTFESIAIIIATVLGPVFAVQAQKYLERRRDGYRRRQTVFRTLMATRASRLSPAHVEALNVIELEFFEPNRRFLKQNKALSRVRSAWQAYHSNLATPFPKEDAVVQVYLAAREELFVDLLDAMAFALGYDEFDKTEIRKSSYNPIAHENIENEANAIRTGFAEILAGKRALPIKVTEFPFVPMGTDVATVPEQSAAAGAKAPLANAAGQD